MMYTPTSAVAAAACMGCYVPLGGQPAASVNHTSYRQEFRADYEPYQPLEAAASFPALSSLAPGRKAVREADTYISCGGSSAPSTASSTASSISSDDWSSTASGSGSARSTGGWLPKAIAQALGISSTKRIEPGT